MVTTWKDLSIGRYVELLKVAHNSTGDDMTDLVEVIAVLSGLTPDAVRLLPLATFKDYSGKALFVYAPLPQPDASKVDKKIKIGEYTLTPCLEARNMNASQFIDFQTYASMKDDDKIVGLLSCLLVPVGKKYGDGYDIFDVQRVIKESLSVVDAMNYQAFFLQWWNGYLKGMLIYSRWIARRIKDETKKYKVMSEIRATLSRLNGVGSHGLIEWQSYGASLGK